jgi:hypothetical protein
MPWRSARTDLTIRLDEIARFGRKADAIEHLAEARTGKGADVGPKMAFIYSEDLRDQNHTRSGQTCLATIQKHISRSTGPLDIGSDAANHGAFYAALIEQVIFTGDAGGGGMSLRGRQGGREAGQS